VLFRSISDRGEIRSRKKKYHFRVEPGPGAAMQGSGIDVVSLANNHVMDYGDEALADTIRLLDGWGILHAGAGSDIASARSPARAVAKGTKVAFLAYCAWAPSPMHAREDRPGVAPLDIDAIAEDVRKAKEDGAVVLVSLHWGRQHEDRSRPGQSAAARAIIDAGADAILGHHPHRPQEVEVHRGRPIVFSLGNLIFGYRNKLYRDNVALVLGFDGTALVTARLVPLAGRNGMIRFRPFPLDGPRGMAALTRIAGLSKRYGTHLEVSPSTAEIGLQ
jgi:poly-gamma-glutamate synthesis protein (capsule biosynthesis protein)